MVVDLSVLQCLHIRGLRLSFTCRPPLFLNDNNSFLLLVISAIVVVEALCGFESFSWIKLFSPLIFRTYTKILGNGFLISRFSLFLVSSLIMTHFGNPPISIPFIDLSSDASISDTSSWIEANVIDPEMTKLEVENPVVTNLEIREHAPIRIDMKEVGISFTFGEIQLGFWYPWGTS